MKGFSRGVKKEVGTAQRGFCMLCLNKIDDYHHKLSNTVVAHKLFPLFVNSPFNCVGLCRECHQQHPSQLRISIPTAAMYEHWLAERIKGESDGI